MIIRNIQDNTFVCDLFQTKIIAGISSQRTPLSIRTKTRRFDIPLDAPVHSPITRIYIVDGAKRAEDINVTLARVSRNIGPFHDAHDFFELFPLRNSGSNIQYELQLRKPLIDKFKAHDQVHFMVHQDTLLIHSMFASEI